MYSFLNLGPICSDNSVLRSSFSNFERDLKIGHYNIQSFSTSSSSFKLNELKRIFNGNLLHIVGLSETWLKPDILSEVVNIPGYNICRSDRPRPVRAGGVALLISKGIKHNIIFKSDNFGVFEAIFAEIIFREVKFLVGVVYLPKGDLNVLEDSIGNIVVRYSNVCIMGDFNMNMFCSRKSNLVRQMCASVGLVCHHNSAPTHFDVDRNSTSLIDYFLLSPSLVISSSGQMQCPGISHHSLIFISIGFQIKVHQQYMSYFDYNAIDSDLLEQTCYSLDFSNMYSTSDVNVQLSILMLNVALLHSLVPIVRRRIRFKSDDWFNSPAILYHISLRDIAYKYYLRNRSSRNWSIYCEHRNRAKRVVRTAKKRAYSDIFQSFGPKKMWNYLRHNGCLETVNSFTPLDPNEVNEYFVSCQTADVSTSTFVDDTSVGTFSFRCVNLEELNLALRKIKSNAAGHDTLSLKFLRIVFPYVSSHILHLVNTVITTSVFPNEWKRARVVPVKKEGDSNSLDNLRPISVLPILSKIVEHIIKDQMILHLDCRSLIHSSQSGFRHGYSTSGLLVGLTDSVRKLVDEGKNVVLISLDLSKAFDRVVHSRLVVKLLRNFAFSLLACKLISSYLYGRSQFVSIGDSNSLILPVTSGVPQGSVIGPLLFMLYLNDLLVIGDGLPCKSFVYADDVQFLCYADSQFVDVLEEGINFVFREVSTWSSENGFHVNPSKTKLIGFGFRTEDIEIVINGKHIEFVDKVKCLGVLVDNHLNFKSHINSISSKISFLLRRLYSLDIHLPLSIRVRVANALLMPHILYCLEVFSGTTGGEFARFTRIFNRIIRFVFGLGIRHHITPYVYRFLGCSFHNYVAIRILLFFYKIKMNGFPDYILDNYHMGTSNRNPQLSYPIFHSGLFERSFQMRLSRMWNALPSDLRCFSFSPPLFRRKLLNYVNYYDL